MLYATEIGNCVGRLIQIISVWHHSINHGDHIKESPLVLRQAELGLIRGNIDAVIQGVNAAIQSSQVTCVTLALYLPGS